MRHFIVFGFSGNSKKETGEPIYIGTDRTKAVEVVNTGGDGFARCELYELAFPQIRRHFQVEKAVKAKKAAPKATK